MIALRRASLFVALAALSLSGSAAGQQVSADSLLRRIDHLERRTSELEQRVRELEALVRIEPSQSRPVVAAPDWRDIQNWTAPQDDPRSGPRRARRARQGNRGSYDDLVLG
jgi:hypothetical protein